MGGFQSDAFHGFEQFVVAGADNFAQLARVEGGEYHACGVSSYAGYGNKQQEECAFLLVGKAIQDVRVLPDGFMDVELGLVLLLQRGKGVERYV